MAHDAPFPGPTIVTIKCAAAAPVIQGPSGCPKIGIRIEPGENRRKKIESEMAKEPFSNWMGIPAEPKYNLIGSIPPEHDWLCARHAEEFRATGSLRLASGAWLGRSGADGTVRVEKTTTPMERFSKVVSEAKANLRELIEADDDADRVPPEDAPYWTAVDRGEVPNPYDDAPENPPTAPTMQRMIAAENEIMRLKEVVLGDDDGSVESRLNNLEDLVNRQMNQARATSEHMDKIKALTEPPNTSTRAEMINDRIEISMTVKKFGLVLRGTIASIVADQMTYGGDLSCVAEPYLLDTFSEQIRKYS
ncbi:hypothetical protein KNU79_gp03 [Gordonia phage NadineRae]|uniref:Uncharacterized protein n=1 Tax=Gordonia phage NadineRae TaxID=2652882 RepID=A0A5P8DGX4_9CAUD|nr:hypothetical protein KNU79_gp03 [Gordonia phage NadineRae]QFP97692.1 hypothetical protein SEA_NADINERAE_3 [Gordonia phage NadineRae]